MAQSWRNQEDDSGKTMPMDPVSISVSVYPASRQPDSMSMKGRLDAYTPITYNVTTSNNPAGNTYKTELVLNRTPQTFIVDPPAPQCQKCKRGIDLKKQSEVQFSNRSYHTECFNCTLCNRRLDDPGKKTFTVHSDGEPLCSQCEVATAKVCVACQSPIVGERSVSFDGKTYHTNCFQCSQCRKMLFDEKDVRTHDSKPCCAGCFSENVAPRCAKCFKPITTGRITVYDTKKYHPECFRCGQCQKVMTEREFFSRDSKPCCNECYNDRSAEHCAHCFKPITTGRITVYDTKKYHPECFRCGQCQKVMTEREFFSRDSKPCCNECYHDRSAEHCAHCFKPITTGKITAYNAKKYHSECFRCGQCQKVMTEREFFSRDSKPCCNECYNQHFAERCAHCYKLILDGKSTVYNTKTYHPDCVRCGQCYKPLGDEKKCYSHDSKPCCNQCYNDRIAPRCEKCSKPIINKCTTFQGKNYHRDCFLCTKCSRVIDSTEKFYDDKLGFLCSRCGA